MRIAITGPTGQIGSKIVQSLLDQSEHQVLCIARNPAKLTDAKNRGATIVEADLVDPAALIRATAKVDALFLMIPPKFDAPNVREFQRSIIDSAITAIRTNEIPHVVLLSSIGAHQAKGNGPIAGLHLAEKRLRDLNIGVTILRPGFFYENYLMSLDSMTTEGKVYMPVAGSARLPMIATRDIAAAAVEALTGPVPEGIVVREMAGERELSLADTAELFGTTAGRPIEHIAIPPAAAREHFLSLGASAAMAEDYIEMYGAFDNGDIQPETPEEMMAAPTSLERYATEELSPLLKPRR